MHFHRHWPATSLAAALLWLAARDAIATPAPPPYSLPWLLRPTGVATVARIDQTVALSRSPATGADGTTAVTSLIGSWKATGSIAPLARISWISNDPPAPGASGTAFSNPLLGVTWARAKGPWRGAALLAATLPVGQGGGDRPDPEAAAAAAAGIPARSAMDNALFAVNYATVIAGAGVARVDRTLTAQAEVTVLRLTRARGPRSADGARTNLTAGLHLGHFFTPRVSLGAELRAQRWMTDAAPVRADRDARETLTAAIGPRFHWPLGGGRWIRPGVSWTHALDRPLSSQGYDMIQIDLPVSF
jgi:hypothetical protein